jgi:hypothetical protein
MRKTSPRKLDLRRVTLRSDVVGARPAGSNAWRCYASYDAGCSNSCNSCVQVEDCASGQYC